MAEDKAKKLLLIVNPVSGKKNGKTVYDENDKPF